MCVCVCVCVCNNSIAIMEIICSWIFCMYLRSHSCVVFQNIYSLLLMINNY